jgi:hypothetical protein
MELDPELKNILIKCAIGREIAVVRQSIEGNPQRPAVSLSFFATLGIPCLTRGIMFNYLDGRVEGFELARSGELIAVRGIYDYFEITEGRPGLPTDPRTQWEFLKRMCQLQNSPVKLRECFEADMELNWRYMIGVCTSNEVIH